MVQSRNPLPEWPLLSLSSSMAPCFLSLLLLLLSATTGSQRHDHWGHHSARHKSTTSDAPSTQIRQACKATRFPNVCESTLSDSDSLPPNPSPFDFILATTNASAAGLQTIRSMIQSILSAFEKASNINRTNTTRICLEVLSYSDHRLSAAFSTALSPMPSAMPAPGPALPSSTSTTAGSASSTPTASPRSLTPWPSPPSLPLPSSAPALTRVFAYPSVLPCWAD